MTTLEWAVERLGHTEQLAATKKGADRDGWLEDRDYWRQIVADLQKLHDLTRYDGSAIANARESLRTYARVLWAIVDDATRNGKPVRVSEATLEAYDRSSKLLIENNDLATRELVLWTDSRRQEAAAAAADPRRI